MCAYMVERDHIRYLVAAAQELGMIKPGDVEKFLGLCKMLWDENRKSIEARYADAQGLSDEDFCGRWLGGEDDMEWSEADYIPALKSLDPIQVLASIACYEYQSCEHEEWDSSQARGVCETLKDWVGFRLRGQHGNTKWGYPPLEIVTPLSWLARK